MSDEEKLPKKSKAGTIMLWGSFLLGLVSEACSRLQNISERTGLAFRTISFLAVTGVAITALIWLHFMRKKKNSNAGEETANGSSESALIKENREKIVDLFRVSGADIVLRLRYMPPRIDIRINFLNLSIFNAKVRKIVYNLETSRGTGTSTYNIVTNKSYDREFVVSRQSSACVNDVIDVNALLIGTLQREVKQSEIDLNGIPFEVKLHLYVTFEHIGEKELTGFAKVDVPPYEVR